VGKQSQDLKHRRGDVAFVEVGSNTTLREYVTVHAATAAGGKTIIGNGCHILAYCHIAHECRLGDRVIMSNATQLAGHVSVGDCVVFGGLGGAVQFVKIGQMAMIGATAKVVQDIVPFCLVEGNPALPVTINKVGMQRNGKSEPTIEAVAKAFRILFRSNLTAEEAVARLQQDFPGVAEIEDIIRFVTASERGVARPKTSGD
jgi:UDP-N-acetylglucosamine acyltransferase